MCFKFEMLHSHRSNFEETNNVRFEKMRASCAIESKNFKRIKPYLEEYIIKRQKNI